MRTFLALMVALAATACLVINSGCEVESAGDSQISITPNSIGLKVNQFVDFTASGGYEYTWGLSDPTYGFLSDTKGQTVRYTSRYSAPSNTVVIQTITVVSTIPGSSTDTNNAGYQVSANAYVEHQPDEVIIEPEELYVSPSSASVAYLGSVEFTATGGDGEYTWWTEQKDWGKLSTTSSSKTTYTATLDPAGTNLMQVLYCTSGDSLVSISITQTD